MWYERRLTGGPRHGKKIRREYHEVPAIVYVGDSYNNGYCGWAMQPSAQYTFRYAILDDSRNMVYYPEDIPLEKQVEPNDTFLA